MNCISSRDESLQGIFHFLAQRSAINLAHDKLIKENKTEIYFFCEKIFLSRNIFDSKKKLYCKKNISEVPGFRFFLFFYIQ